MLTEYFKRHTEIKTARLTFRRLKVEDASDMYEYASRPETTEHLLWRPHTDVSFTALLLKNLQRQYADGEFFDFAVIWNENGKMIGTSGFTAYEPKDRTAEIGYVLNPDYHGRGIATECLSVMMDFAFTRLNVDRVECRYLVGNDASLRVMQKCGMTHEGIKGQYNVKGKYRDYGACAISKEEYFGMKKEIKYEVKFGRGLLYRLFYKN